MIDMPISVRADAVSLEYVPRSATVDNVSPAPRHDLGDTDSDSEAETGEEDQENGPPLETVHPTRAYVIGLHDIS